MARKSKRRRVRVEVVLDPVAPAKARSMRERLAKAVFERDTNLQALRLSIEFLDDLRFDYRRRFAVEEMAWLAPRIKRLDEIRKIAELP
jgi:hypothetical protein